MIILSNVAELLGGKKIMYTCKKKTVGRDVEFIGPILDLKKQNINKPPLENRMFFSFNSQVIHSFIFGCLWLPLPAVIE